MKKLLLTLAAIVGLGFAVTAEEITFDFKTNNYDLPDDGSTYVTANTVAKSGVATATFSGNNEWRYWSDGLRAYARSKTPTITLAVENSLITKISFTTAASFINGYALNDGDKVSITASTTFDITCDKVETAKLVLYGTANKAIEKIVVTYESALTGDQKPADLSFDVENLTVIKGETFTTPKLSNPNNLPVVWGSSNKEVATVNDGVLTIVGVGTTVISATSEATTDFGAGEAKYTLTVLKSYATVAEFYTVGKDGNGLIGFDLTVVYANGANNYATTGTEWTLVYGYNLGLKAGDVIPAGWQGTYSPYNGLPEIKPIGNLPETTTGEAVKIEEVEAVDLTMINKVVVLNGVKFDAETPASGNFEGKIGETTVPFRNQFKVEATAAGTYDVTCAVGYFESDATEPTDAAKIQVYPISYKAAGEAGIDEIGAVENAPVEYFNLQGIRVANPDNGIYIRRQGSKVTKVLVK